MFNLIFFHSNTVMNLKLKCNIWFQISMFIFAILHYHHHIPS
jgi:hypothetical protein